MTTCNREFRHYCVTRSDIPTGLAGAMILHAAGETGPCPPGSIAVLLEARDEAHLRAVAETCPDAHLIHECDGAYAGQLMAIGFAPCEERRRQLSQLRLWRGCTAPESLA